MSTLIHRQHYVWRNYLRAWAENEKIWTLIKGENKVVKTDLMNVAQERFFYKLVDITEFEEKFLREHINRSHQTVQGLQSDFLFAFTVHTKLRKSLNENPTHEIKQQLMEIEVNTMEKAHGLMEQGGQELVNFNGYEDFMGLENPEIKYNAILFMCFQYLRTKKMKKNAESGMLRNSQFNPENVWNIMSFLMATNVAMNVSLNEKLRFLFLDNSKNQNFITTDQPVINILGDKVDEHGNVISLEFYYPLSPNHALVIDFKNNGGNLVHNIFVSEETAQWFNKKMLESSDKFIFSNRREQLEPMITL